MTKMHVSWIARWLVIFACRLPSHGSSAIFLLDNKYIGIAADSKRVGINAANHGTTCKVFVSKSGIGFANVGPLNDRVGSFIDLARDVTAKSSTISEVATRFEATVRPRLEQLAMEIKASLPDYYAREVEGKEWYAFAFVDLGPTGPQIIARGFEPLTNGVRVKMRIHPAECLQGCAGEMLPLGNHDSIDRAYKDGRRLPDNLEGRMEYLIGLELTRIQNAPVHQSAS